MRIRSTLVLLVATACAPAADEAALETTTPDTPQEVTYTAADFSYVGPDTIAPGMTTFRMENTGAQEHHIVLARLAEGRTMTELVEAFQANPTAEPDFVTWVGGSGSAMPAASSTATQDLAPGNYVLICFVPDHSDNGIPHFAKGMVKEIVVAGERDEAPAPTATVEVDMHEFGYTGPDTMAAGVHTFHVANSGDQPHEVALIRLNDGATVDDFLMAMAPGATTPPPGVAVGGNGALSPQGSNWFTIALEPGNYVLLCFIPDPADGVPHLAKGMVKAVTVTAAG